MNSVVKKRKTDQRTDGRTDRPTDRQTDPNRVTCWRLKRRQGRWNLVEEKEDEKTEDDEGVDEDEEEEDEGVDEDEEEEVEEEEEEGEDEEGNKVDYVGVKIYLM